MTDHLQAVLADVAAERARQDDKWGEQNHPSLDQVLLRRAGGCSPQRMAEEYQIPTAAAARTACNTAAERGQLTWGHILIEELAEAIEAATEHGDGRQLRDELVQTAAVTIAWIQRLDRAVGANTVAARVPEHRRPWDVAWAGYRPGDVTPPELRPGQGLDASVAEGWAEPIDNPLGVDDPWRPDGTDDWQTRRAHAIVPFDLHGGYPRNPSGRTGRIGRRLGLWGENPMADAVVVAGTRWADRQVLLIKRGDCGRWALPGGGIAHGETFTAAAVRELREETGVDLGEQTGELIHRGYIRDPRATDWAWACSAATLFQLPAPVPVAGADDAIAAAWWPFADMDTLVRALRAAGGELYDAHYVLLAGAHLRLQKHDRGIR
jgi:ADP-ribose pyrophosphatase